MGWPLTSSFYTYLNLVQVISKYNADNDAALFLVLSGNQDEN